MGMALAVELFGVPDLLPWWRSPNPTEAGPSTEQDTLWRRTSEHEVGQMSQSLALPICWLMEVLWWLCKLPVKLAVVIRASPGFNTCTANCRDIKARVALAFASPLPAVGTRGNFPVQPAHRQQRSSHWRFPTWTLQILSYLIEISRLSFSMGDIRFTVQHDFCPPSSFNTFWPRSP